MYQKNIQESKELDKVINLDELSGHFQVSGQSEWSKVDWKSGYRHYSIVERRKDKNKVKFLLQDVFERSGVDRYWAYGKSAYSSMCEYECICDFETGNKSEMVTSSSWNNSMGKVNSMHLIVWI